MIERSQTKQIEKLIKHFPVVGIVGARQVGKTTLVKRLEPLLDKPCVYFDLESPSVMAQLKENSEWFLSQYQDKTVIIDEVQLMLELFPLLRSLKMKTVWRVALFCWVLPRLLFWQKVPKHWRVELPT